MTGYIKTALYLASASILVSLYACGGSGNSNSTGGTDVGPLGVVEDRSSGLKGTDANANGIRDDVDALIAKEFSMSSEIKKATEQQARATQEMLEATTEPEALAAAGQIMKATSCRMELLSPMNKADNFNLFRSIDTKILALTLNTEDRLLAYDKASSLLGGHALSADHEHSCN